VANIHARAAVITRKRGEAFMVFLLKLIQELLYKVR
jgi:hypothetical protein